MHQIPAQGPTCPTAPAHVTIIRDSNNVLTKRITRRPDGTLNVKSATNLTTGDYRTSPAPTPSALAEIIAGLTEHEALVHGVSRNGAVVGLLATKDAIAEGRAPAGAIARTRDNFTFAPDSPGTAMFDIDLKDAPSHVAPATLDDARAVLIDAVPALAHAPMLALPSASANIFDGDTDERLRGLTGIRVYVWVAKASDIPTIGARVHERLVLGGQGFAKVTPAGLVQVASVLDTSVWQPERLDYAAGAACGQGLEQRRARKIWNDAAAPLALADVPALSDDERPRLAAIEAGHRAMVHDRATKRRREWAAARQQVGRPTSVTWSSSGVVEYLDGEHEVRLHSGAWVTVDEMLREPAKYHNVECYDPLEPDYDGGRLVAKVYAKDGLIHSFAHGGINYTLRSSPNEEFDVIDGNTAPSAPRSPRWARTFDSQREAVEALNREFAFLRTGDILHTPTRRRYEVMSVATFKAYTANARVAKNGKGSRPASEVWLAAFNRRSVSGMAFDPSATPLSDVASKHGDDLPAFNAWPGRAIEPSKTGSCSLFLKHLFEVVAKRDAEVYRWLLHWLAAIVQHPERLPGTALALSGPHGAGKDIIGEVMRAILGPLYINVSNKEQLTGNFNTALENAVFVHVEEAFFAADPRVRGPLKNLITSPTLRINPKGINPYTVQNCTHLLMTSNEPHFAPVEEGDRRYMVLEVSGERAHDLAYHGAVRRQMFEEGGCARLLRHLLKVRVDWDLIRRPLATEAHRVQKLASLPTERAWLFDLLDAGVLPGINRHGVGLIADRDALYASYAKACQAGHRRATQATLTKLLRAYGITDYRPDAEGARPRLYRFPLLATMRAQFEREFGSAIEWTPQAEWSCEPVMANLLVGEPGLKLVEARTA